MPEKKQKQIAFVDCDDWVGLYVNGKLLSEGHSLHWPSVLRRLGFDVVTFDVNDKQLAQHGKLPRLLTDVETL